MAIVVPLYMCAPMTVWPSERASKTAKETRKAISKESLWLFSSPESLGLLGMFHRVSLYAELTHPTTKSAVKLSRVNDWKWPSANIGLRISMKVDHSPRHS